MPVNYVIKHFFGSFLFFAILFISAGKIDYWPGLIYVSIGLVMFALNYTVLRIDPELLMERSKPGEGTRKWDKVILGLSFLVTITMYIVAGLDSGRFHWSPDFPPGVILIGVILTITGQLLFLVAQKQNKFFSSTVRIQTNRGHTVCDTGVYRFVRHPAYLGSVIQLAGFPLLFGSLWVTIPVCVLVILIVIRTALEDRILKNELKGYPEYSGKTRYRIIPYVW
jgi:protein-S-isoprenylcysteine O-methyltransferase Ste14